MRRLLFRLVAIAWLVSGLWAMVIGGSLRAKAELAQWLIAESWQTASVIATPVRPWPWADAQVAARLSIPSLDETHYVMNADSGEAIAFGPGFSSAALVNRGDLANDRTTVISGHRDTHFAFLGEVNAGTVIELTPAAGDARIYRTWRSAVVDSRKGRLPRGVTPGDLLLVTCYPLDALVPGGPLRLVVIAKPVT